MRGMNQDGLGRQTALLVNAATRRLHQGSSHKQGVDTDQSHALLTVIEDSRPHFARIVERTMVGLAVSSWALHSHGRGDVALGEPGAKERLVTSRRIVCEARRRTDDSE